MKIAIIKKQYSLTHGGSEKYCVMLTRGLIARGHDVTVIGQRIDAALAGEVDFLPVTVNCLTSGTKNYSFAVNAGKAARSRDFDVVYSLGRSFGADVVQVMERVQSHWVNVYYRRSAMRLLESFNPRHRTIIQLEQTVYHSPTVKAIVTQSDLDRRLLDRYYGVPDQKIHTIHNGVDRGRFDIRAQNHRNQMRRELGIQSDTPLISFAAMDFKRKGLRDVLAAMAICERKDIHLLVIGDGNVPAFSRIAQQLGIKDRIHFVGRRSDMERCFGGSDLFVFPTLYEPFPTVVVEAMACGVPVITTPDTGAADLIDEGQTGYLVPEIQPAEAIANRLHHHFSRPPSEHQQMSLASANRVQDLTMDRVTRETEQLLLDVYRQLQSTRRRTA